MNIELILYGLIAIIIAIIALMLECRISANVKRAINLGKSEIAAWALILYGIVMIVSGILN